MLKLYHLEGCPYCRMVTDELDAKKIPYEKIEVPGPRHLRTEVIAVSGQSLVPVLVDGDKVLKDEREILKYLETKWP